MKTERRHELQTNALADWIGQHTEQLKPYAKAMLAVAILLVAVVIAYLSYRSYHQRQNAESWNAYYKAVVDTDLEALRTIATTYVGTPAAEWALQSAADIDLATGTEIELYQDRADALERFAKARDDYLQVLETTRNEMLRQRALMGLAQAYESLNRFKDAKQQYEQVIQTWPDTAIADLANSRLAFLEQPSTQVFYDWFGQQKPSSPKLSGEPGSALQTPSIYDDLTPSDELRLPEASDLGRSRDESGFGSLAAPDTATEMPFLNEETGGDTERDKEAGKLDELRASEFPADETPAAEVMDDAAFDDGDNRNEQQVEPDGGLEAVPADPPNEAEDETTVKQDLSEQGDTSADDAPPNEEPGSPDDGA